MTKGYTLATGASALSVFGFSALVGRAVWGFVIGRLGIYRALVLFGFVYGASIVLFLLPTSLMLIYAATAFNGISIAGAQQLQAQVYPDYYGRFIVGTLSGYAGVSHTLGRAIAPLFAAVVYDAVGSYEFAFATFAACCFVAGLAFLFASPPTRVNTS
jgi:sugar phosphate permease